MRTQLGWPAILAALLACIMPARAHRNPNPASNLVMLPGVTITSDGDLPGYPAANAILNAQRTPDADGYQVLFANSWQGAAVYDPATRQHLTITFPSPVTIKGIAWNSGGCENGFYGGGVWSATLDGHVVVNNKTITSGGQGGFMHIPYGADPGTQHEIAQFNPATGTQLVLEFPVTARGPAYNYSIRDLNIEPYVAATALIDRSSMTNKVMCGYQGWFLCPGDGSASWWGWNHWSEQSDYLGPGKYHTAIWPDTREYDASDLFLVPADTTLTYGGTPYLFSSARQGAVNVHFRWMQENGIDGVFHQVFVGGYNADPNDDVQRKLDTVLQNVMNASTSYGRTFALEYDISGVSDADIYNKLTGHWTYVCSAFDLKNHPRYLYHNGKPVVVIWGFGFNDTGHPGTTTTANAVITWFKNNGCFVIGGVPGKWRTLDGDSRSGTAWRDVYRAFNGLTPWTVGRYSSASEITTWKSRVSADITACKTYSQWYMPTAWPRFGWDNMHNYPCGQSVIASRGGQHLWDQLYAWKSAGAACQFIAMFDEYDESTAIMKLTDNIPTAGCWWTTEGKGEDWYLRLANWGSKMQRGEIAVSQTIPISSSTSPDNATILSNTIPTTMNAGKSYDVSVTVKNTGETCWNAEMFKLGGVGDSDPFAATRQLMASGTTVKTNQTYTFNFTMTAPATPGTYTTDWQMMHEIIRWFGAPLTKTVTVVKPVPAFSNLAGNQSITYGTTSVTLGGRVSAAGPIYPASGETLTVSINGNVQSTTINDSTGDFSISYNPSTLPYNASPHTITYSYGGSASLGSASDASTTLTVNKAALTITAVSTNKVYGAPLPGFTASYSGFVNGDTTNNLTAQAVLSTTATAASPAGSYPITASGASSPNYNIAYLPGTLTVIQTLTIATAGTVAYYPTSYNPPNGLSATRVGNVTMSLTGDAYQSVVTNKSDGSYSFNSIPVGGNYSVTPSKADDSPTKNGVTSFDQALIQAHILKLRFLDSPYKLLAADVSGEGTIDSYDQAWIQALILGLTKQFPAGLWRFVPANYVFPDPTNPWAAPTNRWYTNLVANVTNGDFVGIKLGEVANLWTAPAGGQSLLAKSDQGSQTQVKAAVPGVVFAASQQSAQPGQTVTAQVTVSGFSQVTSAQFSLAWDPAVLRYVGTGSYGLKGPSAGSFGATLSASGKLAFAWYDPAVVGVTLADGTVLFSASFEVIGKVGTASAVALAGSPTAQEVSVDFALAAFGAQDGSVAVVGPGVLVNNPGYANGGFRLSVPTEKGRSYILEFTDSLVPAKWTALPAVAGDGTVNVLVDPAATNQLRFYRVRVQ